MFVHRVNPRRRPSSHRGRLLRRNHRRLLLQHLVKSSVLLWVTVRAEVMRVCRLEHGLVVFGRDRSRISHRRRVPLRGNLLRRDLLRGNLLCRDGLVGKRMLLTPVAKRRGRWKRGVHDRSTRVNVFSLTVGLIGNTRGGWFRFSRRGRYALLERPAVPTERDPLHREQHR